MKYQRKIFGYECDIYGHLNNANYLHLLEEARSDALEKIGFPVRKFRDMGIHIYIISLNIKYKKGVELEDTVTIDSRYDKFNRLTSFWKQVIYNSNGDVCAEAELKGAFVKDGKPHRISNEMVEVFRQNADKM